MDVHQNRYGRIPSPPDPRNWSLLPFFAEPAATRWWLPVMRPAKIWNLPVLLDQNGYPRCVGYGSTHYIDMDPVLHAFEADYADQFYFDCKKVDGFPNEDGSTIHAAARVLQQRGLIKNYAWAHALGEVREQLLTRGPMDTGVNWYEGMERPDRNGYIVPSGRIAGGHCVAIRGWIPRSRLTIFNDDVLIPNSWGPAWSCVVINGISYPGHCLLKARHLCRLMREQGEFLAAVEGK